MKPGTNHAPIILPDYKLIFFPLQKVGGTVWKQLFRRMMGFPDWRTGPTWGPMTGLIQLHHFDLPNATRLLNDPTYLRAMMVRDPKDRFLSAYLDKAVKTDYLMTHFCPQPSKNKKSSAQNAAQDVCRHGLRNNHTISFAQFLDITSVCHDTHWMPQSHRLDSQFYPLLDFVGRLETAETLDEFRDQWSFVS